MRRHTLVIPLAALLALSPVLVFGTSCGHDLGFHLQSWVDAAAQLRHGMLYPRWAFTPAWQAGEPRFVFYPPLSWMLGALLTLALPMPATPNTFLFLAMVAAGFSMHAVVRRYTSANGALVAACVYLANPYMFFNAFERSAYAELLAAVSIPLLFLAVLRRKPSVVPAACGIALAWLTNVPAGILSTYTFAVLAATRLFFDWLGQRERQREQTLAVPAAGLETGLEVHAGFAGNGPEEEHHLLAPSLRSIAVTLAAGLLLGLTLPGFYLLPVAYERRWVQSSMVMIANLRYQDNYLFARTAWEPHNVVTHTVSLLAVAMLIASACLLALLFARRRSDSVGPKFKRSRAALTALFAIILFLMLPVSGFLWHLAPELPFLQFPWRLLTILSVVLALSLALLLQRWQSRRWLAPLAALLYVGAAAGITSHLYRQACEIPHMAQYTVDVFRAGHGVPATDEYTPGDADNDVLRTDSPGYWLAPTDDPEAYAPGTVPNPNEVDTNFDGPIPFKDTHAEHAPTHLDLQLAHPAVLVLNLRDFPDWRITRNGEPAPPHIRRNDGLTALPLPAGPSHIDLAWRRGADIYAGDALSLAALLALGFTSRRSRRRARA